VASKSHKGDTINEFQTQSTGYRVGRGGEGGARHEISVSRVFKPLHVAGAQIQVLPGVMSALQRGKRHEARCPVVQEHLLDSLLKPTGRETRNRSVQRPDPHREIEWEEQKRSRPKKKEGSEMIPAGFGARPQAMTNRRQSTSPFRTITGSRFLDAVGNLDHGRALQ